MTDNDGWTEPILSLVGERVALGPLHHDLTPLYQRWDNDLALIMLEEGYATPVTREAIERWYQDAAAETRTNQIIFTIYERESWRPIGRTALHNVDHANRTAEFSIGIGERDCWGRGYGTETMRLMLDYGFTLLGLHNIVLTVYSFNARAIRTYQKAGLKEIGRRRQAVRVGSHAFDVVYMDCLATEFDGTVLKDHLRDLK